MTPPVHPAPARHTSPLAWFALALAVLAVDQLSKWLVVRRLALDGSVEVTPFFNLVLAHNRGAAFSFLAGAGGWQRWAFTGLAIVAAVVLAILIVKNAQQRLLAGSLALILGGALGNGIDRIAHGYVIDFLDFHWAALSALFYGGHYPAFNIADSAITLGVIGFILSELLGGSGRRKAAVKKDHLH